MTLRILRMAISSELDVVAARQRAREIAVSCEFAMQDQVRIATTVSELARNVFNYAKSGIVEFSVSQFEGKQALEIKIEDQGPGIAHLDEVLSGTYKSKTGMGVGLIGARRMMDGFEMETGRGQGTRILMHKLLPSEVKRITAPMVGEISARLRAQSPDSVLAEVQHQNQELLSTLAELKARQEELLQLTAELGETNRGMAALYAELDEKASNLRRADEMKTRFLSNMSHEFRTPLSSIRALSRLLLSGTDGELSTEQHKQVSFILQGTVALNEMVDDLLDMAKIEAGKVDVRAGPVDVAELFITLRGMLRPLLTDSTLALVFEAPPPGLTLYTDQGKLAQILRNFISNAIKFTEVGAVVVRTRVRGGEIDFTVTDTGLGIEARHLDLIFEEFNQVENHLQARVKGTGLGLPLCRKLATLLDGTVHAASTPGSGSVFTLTLPLGYAEQKTSSDPLSITTQPMQGIS